MKLVTGQATSKATERRLPNPRFQQSPGFYEFEPLGKRFNG
jgi:hypothetical protein